MELNEPMNAAQALARLERGNRVYLRANHSTVDISPEVRFHSALNGQAPYAVIVTCSDSRVIPENIFSAGIGELFVIRVAGNVIAENQLGSIEYATRHLGTRLVVVLGHTHCGAVDAAMGDDEEGPYIGSLVKEIREAIGDEKDDYQASILNVRHSVQKIRDALKIPASPEPDEVHVVGAICHLEDGKVEQIP